MQDRAVIVIDIGKTMAKVVLCDERGAELLRRQRPNEAVSSDGLRVLDAAGIAEWLPGVLAECAAAAAVELIVPVAHGAAAAILRDGALARPPLDYEQALPPALQRDYEAQRGDFGRTGSPRLPDGLNLGAQLHLLEARDPDLLGGSAQILTWPQYWAWLLSGVGACDVSSLGCHTDLWNPYKAAPSALALHRGWARRLAPVRPAGAVLGTLRPEWAERTGLALQTKVLCGVHDSNAALLAARGWTELREREATLLSTGTWFVAMRSPGPEGDPETLPEGRDCLLNVDVEGRAVPSARFMGGREVQLLLGDDAIRIDDPTRQVEMAGAMRAIVEAGAMVLPTIAPGTGPFPRGEGRWLHRPEDEAARAAAVALYAALVADQALDLIGARERLLVEGRFAKATIFLSALATLRPDMQVFAAEGDLDLAYGACRLVDPELPPPCRLRAAAPLGIDLSRYRARWRARAEGERTAA